MPWTGFVVVVVATGLLELGDPEPEDPGDHTAQPHGLRQPVEAVGGCADRGGEPGGNAAAACHVSDALAQRAADATDGLSDAAGRPTDGLTQPAGGAVHRVAQATGGLGEPTRQAGGPRRRCTGSNVADEWRRSSGPLAAHLRPVAPGCARTRFAARSARRQRPAPCRVAAPDPVRTDGSQHDGRSREGRAGRRRSAWAARQRVRRNAGRCDGCAGHGNACECVAHRSRSTAVVVHARAAVRRSENAATDEGARGDEETRQRFLRLGHDRKLALESLSGAPQQCLDGSDLHPFVVGDLLVGPPRAFAHGEDMSVARREATERLVHQFAVDGGQDDLFGGICTGQAHGLLRGELQVVRRRTAGAPPQHVGADVAGDHGEPGVEAPLARKPWQCLPRAGESLLRGVLGLVAIMQPPLAEAEQPLVIARVEVPERRGITSLTSLDECAITVEVDVVGEACQLFFPERQPIPSLPPPRTRSHYARLLAVFEEIALRIVVNGGWKFLHNKVEELARERRERRRVPPSTRRPRVIGRGAESQ